jgi:methanogenic corrinoid protein MtbC1
MIGLPHARADHRFATMKERLPEDLVANLAREVIQRIATRDSAIKDLAETPSEAELEKLCLAFISEDEAAAPKIISGLRAEGTGAEVIYLKHLAAAARMLGEWWSEDRVNFTQVTFASGRMFAIMRSMSHLFEPVTSVQHKQALFASVPGEDHTMGVRMAADLFRKDGWDIDLQVGLDHDALVARIEENPSGIVGLSISGEHSIDALSRLVVAVHICCPHVILFVSGQNIDAARPLLALMGLDGVAGEIEDAKEQLSKLWLEKTAAAKA